ncbi:hypothetical protein Bsph_2542 [Lysinibacillus sphaericus C3-41]|uniref:Uncharacterized protein n=1 Tax=Lysinibacillus sphaericus (strain C3-41) TaxID=444177 RepID=B1HXW8_LYSSC|nr:hypothetical protein Bsph_2542 [Lysinibacillus sphaericus C3-41]
MVKALNCQNCAATFNPQDSIYAYYGSYIIMSEAKQITLNEMGHNEFPVQSRMAGVYYEQLNV